MGYTIKRPCSSINDEAKFLESCFLIFCSPKNLLRFDSLSSDSSSLSTASPTVTESIHVYETLLLRICALHQLHPEWNYEDYQVINYFFSS